MVGEDRVTAPPEAASAPPENTAEPPAFPATDYGLVERLLVSFVRREVTRVGLGKVVVGLSGGVDSAVSAAVAARALGPSNVLAVRMPYKTSSPDSLADAEAVVAATGIDSATVDISPQIDAYFADQPEADSLRRGNKMARERMSILYDRSAAVGALVLGTSNKTELLLGYGTLFGDMASALNPIGDLYKTQVWGMAEHLDLPEVLVSKAPSADLWVGQTDEEDLGFGYAEVDRLLYWMVDERCRPRELEAMGFDSGFVEQVFARVQGSQFKRRLPVIAKVSARTIDSDFRYARDWGT